MVVSLQHSARCPCGYCHISDVEFHKQEDHMESFFLAETVKYLWLLFDLAVGPDNLVDNGPYKNIAHNLGLVLILATLDRMHQMLQLILQITCMEGLALDFHRTPVFLIQPLYQD